MFVENVRAALRGEAPWKLLALPNNPTLEAYLASFEFHAEAGKGFGDHLIIRDWESACGQFPGHIVKIWSTDHHLAGYECNH